MKCNVFVQLVPSQTTDRSGHGVEWHANLKKVGTVEGTTKECWAKAKKLAVAPVLEEVARG